MNSRKMKLSHISWKSRTLVLALFHCNSLVVGIFYILCCCLFMQRFVGTTIVYAWVLATAPIDADTISPVRFRRFVYTFFVLLLCTHCIPHSTLIILHLVRLSLFFYRFSNLIVFFLFTSICSKHDFKLPEIAYFFRCSLIERYLLLSLMLFLSWCRCCFHFFHSIPFCLGLVLV